MPLLSGWLSRQGITEGHPLPAQLFVPGITSIQHSAVMMTVYKLVSPIPYFWMSLL